MGLRPVGSGLGQFCMFAVDVWIIIWALGDGRRLNFFGMGGDICCLEVFVLGRGLYNV